MRSLTPVAILVAILLGCSGVTSPDEPPDAAEPTEAPKTAEPDEGITLAEEPVAVEIDDEELDDDEGEDEALAADEEPAPVASDGGGDSCADKIDGVTRHSSTRYTLSQGFMDKYVRNQSRAQKQGSASWRRNKKKDVVGVRLRSLSCAPQVAGLQNNDVIKEINGRAITSSASALSAYSDVSSASRFTVKLRRDKSSMTISYTVE